MGDFNIDLLKYENCKYSRTLLQCMQSFSMLPTIDKPTRVYGSSATLIDNIFTNNLTNNISSGNIVADTTDHFSTKKTKFRDYSSFNAYKFMNDLSAINWKGINEILGYAKKRKKLKRINFIRSNGNSVLSDDPKTIGNTLNKYFSSIGHQLQPIFLKLTLLFLIILIHLYRTVFSLI